MIENLDMDITDIMDYWDLFDNYVYQTIANEKEDGVIDEYKFPLHFDSVYKKIEYARKQGESLFNAWVLENDFPFDRKDYLLFFFDTVLSNYDELGQF